MRSNHTKLDIERLLWEGVARELAHQMGTPLSALMGWMEILPQMKDISHLADDLNPSLERLTEVCERLNQLASPIKAEKVDLQILLTDLKAFFGAKLPAIGKQITIDVQVTGRSIIAGIPILLVWAFEHLLKNAIDACSDGVGEIYFNVSSTDTKVLVELKDNGTGIPLRDQTKIFRAGYSTKLGGRGMGLAIAKYIIERKHQGEILLISTKTGIGSTFQVALPYIPNHG
jgi:signal transduction histidine kinase